MSAGARRDLVVWAVMSGLGLLLLVGSYLPVLNPEQCPQGFTQAQIDESGCVVGANIGAGLVRLVGLVILTTGGLAGLIALSRGGRA